MMKRSGNPYTKQILNESIKVMNYRMKWWIIDRHEEKEKRLKFSLFQQKTKNKKNWLQQTLIHFFVIIKKLLLSLSLFFIRRAENWPVNFICSFLHFSGFCICSVFAWLVRSIEILMDLFFPSHIELTIKQHFSIATVNRTAVDVCVDVIFLISPLFQMYVFPWWHNLTHCCFSNFDYITGF